MRFKAVRLGARYGRAGSLALLLLILSGAAARAEEGTLSEARVSFALGLKAFNDGEFEEAARLFQEAADYDPEPGDTLYWLGLTWLRLGRPADAAARLEESLRVQGLSTAERRRARSDLQLAREALAKGSTSPIEVEPPLYDPELPLPEDLPRWEARTGVEALYDSNPGLLPEDFLFPLPGNPTQRGATPDDAARLDLGVEYHPFYSRGWSLGVAVDGQHSMYREQGLLDLSLMHGTVSLSWGGSRTGSLSGPLGSTRVPTAYNRIALLLQGGGAGIWLDGDAYLGLAEGAFSLHVRESTRTATRVDLEARSNSYERDAQGSLRRSGTDLLAGTSQTLFLGRDDRYLRLGVIAGERQAGRAFDSSSGEVLAEAEMPLNQDWTLSAVGFWRKDWFDHVESSLAIGRPERREDTTWRIALAAAFNVNDQLRWTVRGSHIRRDSNVRIGLGSPLFDYERTTFSLGFDWRP